MNLFCLHPTSAPVRPRFCLLFRTHYFFLFGLRSDCIDPHQSPIGIKTTEGSGLLLTLFIWIYSIFFVICWISLCPNWAKTQLGSWQRSAFSTQLTNLKSGCISHPCKFYELWIKSTEMTANSCMLIAPNWAFSLNCGYRHFVLVLGY